MKSAIKVKSIEAGFKPEDAMTVVKGRIQM
jgi:hypothetical protein